MYFISFHIFLFANSNLKWMLRSIKCWQVRGGGMFAAVKKEKQLCLYLCYSLHRWTKFGESEIWNVYEFSEIEFATATLLLYIFIDYQAIAGEDWKNVQNFETLHFWSTDLRVIRARQLKQCQHCYGVEIELRQQIFWVGNFSQ